MSGIMRSISNLEKDEIGIITGFSLDLSNRTRIMEMGLLKDVTIRMVKKSPLKGLIELKIRSYYVTLRYGDAMKVYIK